MNLTNDLGITSTGAVGSFLLCDRGSNWYPAISMTANYNKVVSKADDSLKNSRLIRSKVCSHPNCRWLKYMGFRLLTSLMFGELWVRDCDDIRVAHGSAHVVSKKILRDFIRHAKLDNK